MRKMAIVVVCIVVFLLYFMRFRDSHSLGSTDTFWSDKDIEGFRIDGNTELREVAVTLFQQPKFYAGPAPLKYTSYIEDVIPRELSAGATGGVVVVENYPGFKTMYVYGDSPSDKLRGIPIGAVTMSESNDLVAQAKLITRTPNGLVIEEQDLEGCHEGKCSLIFKATSSIDQSGTKTAETNPVGRKKSDYYFLWPMGLR